MIAENWGEEVAKIVEEVTDDKALPMQERKDKQVESAHPRSQGGQADQTRRQHE